MDFQEAKAEEERFWGASDVLAVFRGSIKKAAEIAQSYASEVPLDL